MKLASFKRRHPRREASGGLQGSHPLLRRRLYRADVAIRARQLGAHRAQAGSALHRRRAFRRCRASGFHEREALSPLPRAYQWADGSAYINHVELVRKARGAEVPESFYKDPLMYQGGSDGFLAPRQDIPLGDTAWGCDMEGEIAVITDDVPMGVKQPGRLRPYQAGHAGQRREPSGSHPQRTCERFSASSSQSPPAPSARWR